MNRKEAQEYVRAIWPAAQHRYHELLDAGLEPEAAAHAALNEIEGLSWSHQEALEAASYEE